MALNNNIIGGGTFRTTMQIIGGQWTVPVDEGTESAVSRKYTKGKHEGETVWEIKSAAMDGLLMSGELVENEYIGLQANVVLKDEDGIHCLEFPATSQYAKAFISCLPYIDKETPLHIQLSADGTKKTKSGAQKFKLGVAQDGKLLKNHYVEYDHNLHNEATGKNGKYVELNGMPPSVKKISGWDFSDQNEFLLQAFNEFFEDYEAPIDEPAEPKNEAVAAVEAALNQPSDVPLGNVAEPPEPILDDSDIPF